MVFLRGFQKRFMKTTYVRGTVDSWDDRAGYGYILPDDPEVSSGTILVHRKSLRSKAIVLQPGDRVLFFTEEIPRGMQASDVHHEIDSGGDPFETGETRQGVIAFTANSRGYGFIEGPNKERIFYHFSSLSNPDNPPSAGTSVIFRIVKTDKGLQALDINIYEKAKSFERNIDNDTSLAHTADDLLARAILARDNRDYDLAANLYQNGLKKCPSIKLILSYAAMEKNRNRKPMALSVFEEGINYFPNSAKLREDAGNLAASMGDYNKALEFLHKSLELIRATDQGGEIQVLLSLARTYNRLGNKTGSQSELVQSINYYKEVISKSRHISKTDILEMNIAQIRTQHYRGNLAIKFFQGAGFKILRARLFDQVTVGADIILEINNPEIIESYAVSGQFLARCMFKSDVTHPDIEDLDGTIHELGNSGLIDEQVALLVVSSLPNNLQRTLFKRIEERQLLPAIVPIPQSEIEKPQGPMVTLRAVMDQWLYRRDLFSLNFPVVGKRFFGRDKPLAELRDAISQGTPTGIFGLRKVGKTSLLKETERRANETGDIVIYMDMLRVPSDISDTRWLYWNLASKLHERFSRTAMRSIRWRLGGVFEDFLDVPNNFPVATAFDADMTQILNAMKTVKTNPRPKVVLLIDEVERLLPNALGKEGFKGYFDFFGYLRGLCQETSDFVVIVTAANAGIAEAAQFEGRDNPVFNFFKEIYLQFLEPKECSLMIKSLGRGMGLRFNDSSCDNIYKLTGGHPFFTRQFCSFIAERCSERPQTISEELVIKFVDQYLEFSGKDFQEILSRFSRDYPEERDLCIALAQAGGRISIERINKNSIQKRVNIRHLVGYQIVRIDDGELMLTMELLKRWLQRWKINGGCSVE
jgi:cold shock CspA family protein